MVDRYKSPHPLPTDRQRELLTIMIEECSEVIKDATKWLRFGAKDIDPGKGDGVTNDERVALEIGDVSAMVELLKNAGMVDGRLISEGHSEKLVRVERFMQSEEDE